MQLAAIVLVLVVSLISGFVTGIVAKYIGKARPFFHDDYHFTTCGYKTNV